MVGVTWAEEDGALARKLMEESLAIYDRYGDMMAASLARIQLGHICCRQDDRAAGQAIYGRCLEDARREGDQRGIWYALESLATSYPNSSSPPALKLPRGHSKKD